MAPRPVAAELGTEAHGGRPSTWLVQAIHDIERTWLDVVAPPFAERLAEHGAGPDDGSRYCHRCGLAAGPHETTASGCAACRDGSAGSTPWDRLVRLGEYVEPWSGIVTDVKFTRWRRLGSDVGVMLGRQAGQGLREAGIGPRGRVLVIPAPVSFRRRVFRGIDHALVLARGVASGLREGGHELARVRRGLWRRHRPSQASLPASERKSNIGRTIRPRGGLSRLLAGTAVDAIVVVDDVLTTGATMRACCRAVRAACRGLPRDRRPVVLAAIVARTSADRR
ncbi:MAG: ComF family protein [Phycisphaeraceae bacterium]|nr:ComF family protein [Phycisphaeraceae bacterium]